MPDNPSTEDLRKITNEQMTEDFGGLQARQSNPNPQSQEPENLSPEPPPVPEAGEPPKFTDEELAFYKEMHGLKQVGDLPFKSANEFINGYKELQGRFSKDRERYKPYDYILDTADQDPRYREWLRQADTLYRNPQLAQSYVTPQAQVATPPDPGQFDRYTAEGEMQYQQKLMQYMETIADRKANERVYGIQQQLDLEKQKLGLKSVFPDENPDDIMRQIQARGNNWTLADAAKALRYDQAETRAMDKARKELAKKLEEAGRSGTPQSPSSSPKIANLDDILSDINQYGSEYARKKYGVKKTNEAVREATNF